MRTQDAQHHAGQANAGGLCSHPELQGLHQPRAGCWEPVASRVLRVASQLLREPGHGLGVSIAPAHPCILYGNGVAPRRQSLTSACALPWRRALAVGELPPGPFGTPYSLCWESIIAEQLPYHLDKLIYVYKLKELAIWQKTGPGNTFPLVGIHGSCVAVSRAGRTW